MLLLERPAQRNELVRRLYLQDLARVSQLCVLANRALDTDVERAAASVAQLLEEYAARQRNDRHIEEEVREEAFLRWYSLNLD